MLDKIKIATKDSFIYSLGNFSTKIIGLILLPIYTKELTVAEYGILGTLEVTLQVLIAVFGFSIYKALNRWYWDKKYRDKQKSIFFTSLSFVLIASLMMILIMASISERLSVLLLESEKYSYLLNVMVISSAMQIIAQIPLALMRLQRKAVLFSVSNILKLFVTLVLTIYFIVHLGKKVEGIFEAQVIGYVLFFIFIFRYNYRNIKLKFEKTILREMVQFSYPLMIASFGGVMLTVADRYIVRFIGGLNDIGIYSLGFKIGNLLKVLVMNSLLSAIMPLRFKMIDEPDNKRFYSKIFTYSIFGFMFFLMAVTFFGRELVVLLAKKQAFWEAYKIIPIICFAQLFEMMRRSSNMGLIINKKTKIISRIMLSISVLNIFINIGFIYLFDIIGAAIATMTSQLLFFILMYRAAQKSYFIPYELGKVFKMIFVVIGLTLIAFMLNSVEILPRIGIKLILIASFPVILYFLNFYEPIEIIRLKQGWKKWKKPKDWKKNFRNINIK